MNYVKAAKIHLKNIKSSKNGASTLEMLFASFTMMFIFMFVMTIFLFLLFRGLAIYSIIRTVRVEGIMSNSSYSNIIKPDSGDFRTKIIEGAKIYHLYIGNIVEQTFYRTTLQITRDEDHFEGQVINVFGSYNFILNNPLFQRFIILNETFFWSDPLKPNSVKEKFTGGK